MDLQNQCVDVAKGFLECPTGEEIATYSHWIFCCFLQLEQDCMVCSMSALMVSHQTWSLARDFMCVIPGCPSYNNFNTDK